MKGTLRLPEIPLALNPATPEARAAAGFKWAARNVGRRHKLGGSPDWIQGAEVPACPDCKQAMTFYGQLDSVGDDVTLADAGMIYVFVCFDCYTTTSVLQSG